MEGSPAHAGIDPGCTKVSQGCHRLPRTRGDRPWESDTVRVTVPAPPHTRGSTAGGCYEYSRTAGSPAHAGIDPADELDAHVIAGLPRTRVDRPDSGKWTSRNDQAAPHTRGSTHRPDRHPCAARGCPAHAGIDPLRAALQAARRWLPRTRGDRPFSRLPVFEGDTFPVSLRESGTCPRAFLARGHDASSCPLRRRATAGRLSGGVFPDQDCWRRSSRGHVSGFAA